ncbi:MAG: MBL fold metallo-hydrolase [Desulfatibacillaceae bacterium]|nr:MBL fold metallo-hydrolase [Desulfatibacillaceae bacterium]
MKGLSLSGLWPVFKTAAKGCPILKLQKKTGKIAEDFYLLLNPEIPLFLADGDNPVAFDAGFACLGPFYADAISGVLGNRPLKELWLTHSHYDHCGAAGYLQQHIEGLAVGAAPGAARVMERPGAVEVISQLSRVAYVMMKQIWGLDAQDIDFAPYRVDRILRQGFEFEISSRLSVRVIETPGHTRDCISFHLPQIKALISSEAAGIPDVTGYIYADFLVDYDMYRASLEKLAMLDLDLICVGHGGVIAGPDAAGYIKQAMSQCAAFKDEVERLLNEEHGDMDRVMALVRATEYDPKPDPKQPEPAYLLNLKARVAAIHKRLAAQNQADAC